MKKIVALTACVLTSVTVAAAPAAPVITTALASETTAEAASLTAQAKVIVKKKKGYYNTKGWTGYKYYNGKLYKFNSKNYMPTAKYKKMVKALKNKSYKQLKAAIGSGKRIQKTSSCNGGKYDYVYKYGKVKVYTTDNTITYIK